MPKKFAFIQSVTENTIHEINLKLVLIISRNMIYLIV